MPMLKVATFPRDPELKEANIDSLLIVMKDATISSMFETTINSFEAVIHFVFRSI